MNASRNTSLTTGPEEDSLVSHLRAFGCVCYGAGGKGRQVSEMLQSAGVPVLGFIDREPREAIRGIPVYGLQDSIVAEFAAAGRLAVVSVFNHLVSAHPIRDSLANAGFQRIVGFGELCQTIPVPDTYWLAEIKQMLPHVADSEWLRGRLADNESRKLLSACLDARTAADATLLPPPSVSDQYYPEDIPLPRHNVHFVDVGAYHGETIAGLIATGFELTEVTAFEPDHANFRQLVRAASGLSSDIRTYLYPCGLSDSQRFVRFDARGEASDLGVDIGKETAMLVALDQVMPRGNPSYVKFDIEGGEAAALGGARDTIRRSRPALAVAVYHRPADLWQLPRMIDDLLPDSHFFLRLHGHHGFDLVLYAVPK
jgi:FkbM family methyltransferase